MGTAEAARRLGVKLRKLCRSSSSTKAIQYTLGHVTTTETLNTYSHLWPEDEDRTRDAIQAALTPNGCARNVRDGVAAR